MSETSSWWPRIRAALLAFHVAAVVVLSLPGGITEKRLQSRGTQKDLQDWAARLRDLGFETTPEALEEKLRSVSDGYVEARKTVSAPFSLYARASAMFQGWAMFASPQRFPSELHVDGRFGSEWRKLYRPHDAAADLHGDFFRHNRVRKFQGRFARGARSGFYDAFAAYVARRTFEELPDVEEVRVSLYSYETLPPDRVRRGERPLGEIEQVRTFAREAAP